MLFEKSFLVGSVFRGDGSGEIILLRVQRHRLHTSASKKEGMFNVNKADYQKKNMETRLHHIFYLGRSRKYSIISLRYLHTLHTQHVPCLQRDYKIVDARLSAKQHQCAFQCAFTEELH